LEVLDKALELPEYPGRVRGAGYGVHKDYFVPKNKRRRFARADKDELEARMRVEVEARVREEVEARVREVEARVQQEFEARVQQEVDVRVQQGMAICMKSLEERLQGQLHAGNASHIAPSSCLNESPAQGLQGIPGVESPQDIPVAESPLHNDNEVAEGMSSMPRGNPANAPSSCLNESPAQALQGIPGVESPQTDDIINRVIQVPIIMHVLLMFITA
jgi:hypothetical protein